MMHHNFWRGERIRLRAVEQKDLDELLTSTDEPNTELDRADDFIGFPISSEQARENLATVVVIGWKFWRTVGE